MIPKRIIRGIDQHIVFKYMAMYLPMPARARVWLKFKDIDLVGITQIKDALINEA